MFLYSSKLIQKEPRTGGAFQWHQDYGYWYMSGNMTPDMCSVFIAMDPYDMDNGCLEVCNDSTAFGVWTLGVGLLGLGQLMSAGMYCVVILKDVLGC